MNGLPSIEIVLAEPGGTERRFSREVSPTDTAAQAVYLSGPVPAPVLCSGLGRCGRCRMGIEVDGVAPEPLPKELLVLTPKELESGIRLGCLHRVREGMLLRPLVAPAPVAAERPPVEEDEPVSVAVDFGTTSLCARVLALDGESRGEACRINPQMGAGADVISRLAYAGDDDGFVRLREVTRKVLEDIVEEAGGQVLAVCLAGNPAMTSLAVGWNISGLAAAPYGLPHKGGFWATLPDSPDYPLVFIPPQLSPFVGGDISAGYAALAHAVLAPGAFAGAAPAFPFVLADLGTNGEILLALSPERAVVASVALGPALEGAGLTFGSEARSGVITGFSLSPKGLEPRFYDADTKPRGISGTGHLSLLACLLRAGAMDVGGHFTPEKSPLLRKFFVPEDAGGFRLSLPGGMYLSARDVEEILKVKAAFSLGLQLVLAAAGLDSRDPAAFYVAGALGLHVAADDLELLGFFPAGAATRVRACGNTSLEGAALLLQSEPLRVNLGRWAAGVTPHAPAEDPLFHKRFANHMRFAWEGSA